MYKHFLLGLSFLLLGTLLSAQVNIFGLVTLGNEDGPGIPDWPVELTNTLDGSTLTASTDEEGLYEFSVDFTGSGDDAWQVQTLDICIGTAISMTVEFNPATLSYEVNFVICAGINPPPPTECEPYFYYEQVPSDEGFAIHFFDLSHAGDAGIDHWEWDFGDGNTSTEQNPVHVYAEPGAYDVTLSINGEDCAAVVVQEVIVYDAGDCDCPTDEYDPVCVFTPSGAVLEFVSPCFAECAGYAPDQYSSCDGNECDCPDFYAPVCVVTPDGETIQFQNHCFAECAGYGPDHWVDCEDDCNCPEDVYEPVCVYNPFGLYIQFDNACLAECAGFEPGQYQPCDGGCECPEFYDPVCVILDDGTVLTFSNYCFAQCEGYGPDQWEDCENDCECPEDIYDPVCVATPSGLILTFINPCEAECAGYGPDIYYHCDGNECGCPEYYDPVCVVDPAGNIITFDNVCFAECAGYGPDQFVDCEDECGCEDAPGEEVCVQTPFGVIPFPNSCYAECAGFGPDTWLDECPQDCICDDVWDPVCVISDDGAIITFGNPCEAACFGFGPDDFVDCTDDCNCTTEWDPVCVTTSTGVIVTYPNACVAECEGFSPGDFVDCGECSCDDYYLPVCVIDPATGALFEFQNPCFAICEGYAAEDIFPCDNGSDCYADFSYVFIDDTEVGYRVNFTDQSFTVDGITSWFWDFGDGATSAEQNPSHVYAVAGVYDVTLVIESPDCGTLTVTYHLCVGEGGGVGGPACQSFFFFEQPDPNNLLSFQFIDFSLGNINAWIWDFGDGESSTDQNPIHTYAAEGYYLVSLTVISDDCESTVQIGVTAGENVWYGNLECRAWFLPIINPATLEVYFINLSSPDAVVFNWDFGDGTTSTDPLAFHAYAEPGTYTVTLTTTSADGCTNTFSVTINLSGEEDGFTSNPVFSLVSSTQEVSPAQTLRVAPNPTTDRVQITWEMTTASDYNWQLFDLNGRLLEQQKLSANEGQNSLNLDLSAQPSGIYLFRLQSNAGQKTIRLSKL